jgi:PAS domain S-box-containing protein
MDNNIKTKEELLIELQELRKENESLKISYQKDMSDRKKTEEALIRLKNDFQGYFDMSSVGIGITSQEKGWIEVNDCLCQMLGYTKQELYLLTWAELTHPEDMDSDLILFNQVLSGEIDRYQLDKRFIRKDGTEVYTTLNVSCNRKSNGTVEYFLASLIDVSARIIAEIELKNSKAEIEEKQKLLAKIAENYPNSFLSIIEKDLSVGYTAGQEFKHQNLNPEDFVGLTLEQVFGELTSTVKEYYLKTFNGEETSFELFINNMYQLYKTVPLYDEKNEIARIIVVVENITDRKKAEIVLFENQKQLTNTLESISDAFFSLDDDLVVTYFNNAAENLLHKKKEDVIGQNLFDVFTEARGSLFEENYSKAIREKTFMTFEVDFEKEPYNEWYDVRVYPQENGISVYFQVVTDKKNTLEALRKSESLKEQMLKNIGDVIVIIDKDGINRYKSPNIEQLFGWKPEDVVGKSTWDNVHPDDLEAGQNFIRSLTLEQNTTGTIELRYKKKDSSYCWIEITIVNLLHDKDVQGFLGNYHDITERKRAEEELKESEEKYRLLYESNQMPIAIFDAVTLKFLSVNNAFIERYGYTQEEFLTMTILEIRPDSEIEKVKQSVKLNDKGLVNLGVYLHKKKNGEIIQVEIIRYELVFEGKNAKLVFANDVTEKIKTEDELILAYDKLKLSKERAEESDKLKSAFLQNMSHEIRTPLNGILGFSNLLQADDLTKEEIKEFTGVIQNSGKRLMETVGNILDISKIETGQLEMNIKSFSLNSLISSLYTFFSNSATIKGVILDYHVALKNPDSFIESDEIKLNQILTNLINNALKFTIEGKVEFGYSTKDSEIEFYIKDTGVGIPEESKNRMFVRFAQANLEITRGYEGAGLGLSICKGLVELLGGKIWFESEVNVGSKFFFTIPYKPITIIDFIPENEAKIPIIKEKIQILVAEDDCTSFQYIKILLSNSDCTLIHAENGEIAVEKIKSSPEINLVLMDIKMPVMNGIEATKLIKQLRPELPIIAQTAYAFTVEKEMILAVGCDDYISKPISKENLLKLIEKYS